VLGNREVVIKNIGPQLARMPGIAGATVLGSGEIVLILNPVLLAGSGVRRAPPDQAPQAPRSGPAHRHRHGGRRFAHRAPVTQRLLEREGYRVLLAKDGVDALEQMQEVRPDLMLVDIEMPRMDGFDLTRHVRGDASTRAVPIIMITSRTADKHRNYALGLGVNAYFGKPFQEPVAGGGCGLAGARAAGKLTLATKTSTSFLRRQEPDALTRATWVPPSTLGAQCLEPLQRLLPRRLVIHHRPRIIPPQHHARVPAPRLGQPRRMNRLRHPARPAAAGTPDEGPSASNLRDCVTGLKIRNHGCASQPVDAAHCQPPLFEASS
jgi:CheY-like chemotaxis protein